MVYQNQNGYAPMNMQSNNYSGMDMGNSINMDPDDSMSYSMNNSPDHPNIDIKEDAKLPPNIYVHDADNQVIPTHIKDIISNLNDRHKNDDSISEDKSAVRSNKNNWDSKAQSQPTT